MTYKNSLTNLSMYVVFGSRSSNAIWCAKTKMNDVTTGEAYGDFQRTEGKEWKRHYQQKVAADTLATVNIDIYF